MTTLDRVLEGSKNGLNSQNCNFRCCQLQSIPLGTEACLRRSFVRACLFQPGERQRLDSLVGSAAGDAGRTSALERAAPVELAVHAASSGSWDRFAYRLVCVCWSNTQQQPVNPGHQGNALHKIQASQTFQNSIYRYCF